MAIGYANLIIYLPVLPPNLNHSNLKNKKE